MNVGAAGDLGLLHHRVRLEPPDATLVALRVLDQAACHVDVKLLTDTLPVKV